MARVFQGLPVKLQTFLEGLGYKIFDIGNADESGRTTTLIKTKSDKAKYQAILAADLKDKFTTEVTSDLAEDSEYDVLIIVGTDAKL